MSSLGTVNLTQNFSYLGRNVPAPKQSINDLEASACPEYVLRSVKLTIPVWAKAYYQQKRTQGQSHQAAVRALAFKWMRILFRCWQDRRPYDESVYLRALQQARFTAAQTPGLLDLTGDDLALAVRLKVCGMGSD